MANYPLNETNMNRMISHRVARQTHSISVKIDQKLSFTQGVSLSFSLCPSLLESHAMCRANGETENFFCFFIRSLWTILFAHNWVYENVHTTEWVSMRVSDRSLDETCKLAKDNKTVDGKCNKRHQQKWDSYLIMSSESLSFSCRFCACANVCVCVLAAFHLAPFRFHFAGIISEWNFNSCAVFFSLAISSIFTSGNVIRGRKNAESSTLITNLTDKNEREAEFQGKCFLSLVSAARG